MLLIRDKAKYLISIGACAVAGSIQALKNFTNDTELLEWQKAVYPQETQVIIDEDLLTAKAIKEYVNVDFEKFLEGREPNAIIDAVARICGICPLCIPSRILKSL